MTINVESWVDPVLITAAAAELCPEVLEAAEADLDVLNLQAAEFFYWQTGFRFPGMVTRTADPCWTLNDTGYGWSMPELVNGQWFNRRCGHPFRDCCTETGILLRPRPVWSVSEVRLDDEVFPSDNYDLRLTGRLVRTDGQEWPTCGGIEIDFVSGAVPVSWLAAACREYTLELYCLHYCPEKCRLPDGWTRAELGGGLSVSRDDIEVLKGLSPSINRALTEFKTASGRVHRRPRVLTPDVAQGTFGRPVA